MPWMATVETPCQGTVSVSVQDCGITLASNLHEIINSFGFLLIVETVPNAVQVDLSKSL